MANTKKVVKDKAFFAAIGRKGGMATKRRQLSENPNYYSEIGFRGGEKMKNTHGKEFYSKIGKIGKREAEDQVAE